MLLSLPIKIPCFSLNHVDMTQKNKIEHKNSKIWQTMFRIYDHHQQRKRKFYNPSNESKRSKYCVSYFPSIQKSSTMLWSAICIATRHAVYDSTVDVYKPLKSAYTRLFKYEYEPSRNSGASMRAMNVVSSATSQNKSRRWER